MINDLIPSKVYLPGWGEFTALVHEPTGVIYPKVDEPNFPVSCDILYIDKKYKNGYKAKLDN